MVHDKTVAGLRQSSFRTYPHEGNIPVHAEVTWSDWLCSHAMAILVYRRAPVSRACSKAGRPRFLGLAHWLRYQVRFPGKQGNRQRPFHPEDLGISRGRYKGTTTRMCRLQPRDTDAISKEWMKTVTYTNDCATIPSVVLSEVLRYGQVQKLALPPLTVAPSTGFFQPLGSSLPQTVRPKSSKGFLSTQRSLGLSSNAMRETVCVGYDRNSHQVDLKVPTQIVIAAKTPRRIDSAPTCLIKPSCSTRPPQMCNRRKCSKGLA